MLSKWSNHFSYFAKRFVGEDPTLSYAKMAGGPYNSKTRYKGPEKIALKNGYIKSAGKRGIKAPKPEKFGGGIITIRQNR